MKKLTKLHKPCKGGYINSVYIVNYTICSTINRKLNVSCTVTFQIHINIWIKLKKEKGVSDHLKRITTIGKTTESINFKQLDWLLCDFYTSCIGTF